ncbi:ankyrin repeat-containing protein BDA1 isoform X2 [Raphanus sativus]|uniref:Ankyrin repeat-containing protein BDA1 isoform X2 n=1 Tax=Raphanus sativus TaxID=3726 RepID=A0A9W3CVP5_RAPSA|nr:ankyrin repeat-containing protein BDA1-like isoform X2 [Raphanus sativus]XP_056857935.1 ankyrin repeat-containing protein BDA1-like isoform X2 [Raphanus sativus]XP_056860933.1 ankyrin repeat-containing protein BDA1 isoform X2 [Raphanus sativus]
MLRSQMSKGVFCNRIINRDGPSWSEEHVVAGKFPRQRSSVYDLDKEGFTPLHAAAGAGQVETVRAILGIDKKFCRLKGRDGKTPLHVAAMRGKTDVIREIVSTCVDCVEDETVQGQTALHLAVMHQETGAVIAIVELITETNRIEVLYKKDEQGNTALHLATWRKNRQVIEVLVEAIPEESRTFEVNAMNKMCLSSLDLLVMFPSEAGDREIYEKLTEAGAQRGGTTNVQRTTSSTSTCQERAQSHKDLVKYFTFKKHRDSPSEARSALLVVASLVATATFQASLTPPGGTWQDSYTPEVSKNTTTNTPAQQAHIAGQSIMGTFNGIAFTLFVFFNTIGFSVSLSMLNILTLGFPLRFQLQICMMAMYFSHNTAMTSVAPDHVKLYCVLITSILAAATPSLMRLLEKPMGILCQLWDSMLQKISCQ